MSLFFSEESNSNLKEGESDERDDVNMNPGHSLPALDNPFEDTDVGLHRVALNVAFKRWHNVNGLDLNSPVSTFSGIFITLRNRWQKRGKKEKLWKRYF